MTDYMKRVANEYCEAVKIIKQTICEQFTVCLVGAEQVATAILARLAHQKLLLENVDNLNRAEEIRDAAITLLRYALNDCEPDSPMALLNDHLWRLQNAIEISAEELREGK
jgi:hypothetical protein